MTFYSSPGICDERMYVFLAEQLTAGTQELEESEHIAVEVLSLDLALKRIRDGEVRDAKTLAAVLYWSAFGRDP
jgi:ADP-ribose pyrophosphatase